jgi:hypothetical protein
VYVRSADRTGRQLRASVIEPRQAAAISTNY